MHGLTTITWELIPFELLSASNGWTR